jgi:hypothetical protein
MLDAESWIEPSVEWRAAADITTVLGPLTNGGELLTTWPPAPFESTPTDCYRLGDEYWIVQAGVGAVTFTSRQARLTAFPSSDGVSQWFREVLTRSWLPAIYPFWGRQVLHASAATLTETGAVVAFSGPTQSGKSTTAYALGRRAGWQQIADDSLAFSWRGSKDGIGIHPLQNEARLRSASAQYFGASDEASQPVAWPGRRLTLGALYLLEGSDTHETAASFTRLKASESLPLLLQQAFALSFAVPEYNRQLMTAYAHLAAGVPAYRLTYRRSFEVADSVYDAIEEHLATELQLGAARHA